VFDIPEELKKLPTKPGVYIMKDANEVVIYVGKAVNLRNRVRNYFQHSNADVPKIRGIVHNIQSFEYIVTDTEIEALILECNLIKKHRPRYNVLLKDDKTYPYIKLTANEEFPRVFMTRRHKKDGAKYYGPYTNVGAVAETLSLVRSLWPLRECTRKVAAGDRTRPCLNRHIGKCTAPCSGTIAPEAYAEMVAEVVEFLNGKRESVLKSIEKEMLSASEAMEFEKAASYRDKIQALRKLEEQQKLDTLTDSDRDVIGFARDGDDALVQVFFVRHGKMIGREHFMLNGAKDASDAEIIKEFITQFYSGTPFIPRELVLQADVEDREVMLAWLEGLRGHKVALTVPKIGEKLKLVRMAENNASIVLRSFGEQMKRERAVTLGAVDEIRKALGIETPLGRIEAYDISNIQGFESVASMVVFEDGKPKRSDYRKFKVKTVVGANDYASMQEVLTRRLMRYQKEAAEGTEEAGAKFSKLPDAIFVDGGKPQVAAAESVLAELGISILVCGMVKDDRHRTKGLLYQGKEILMPHASEGFKLITRMQDEVHRFAIEYHRKLREKAQIRSVLDDIKGIGAARRKALLKHFGSVEDIAQAEVEALKQAEGMNIRAAEDVYAFFHKST